MMMMCGGGATPTREVGETGGMGACIRGGVERRSVRKLLYDHAYRNIRASCLAVSNVNVNVCRDETGTGPDEGDKSIAVKQITSKKYQLGQKASKKIQTNRGPEDTRTHTHAQTHTYQKRDDIDIDIDIDYRDRDCRCSRSLVSRQSSAAVDIHEKKVNNKLRVQDACIMCVPVVHYQVHMCRLRFP